MTRGRTEAAQAPLSVSDAVGFAKAAVEGMPTLVVTGEVSGFRGPARTGHCYFQLKDDSSAMDAIVWKGIYQASGVQLRDGLQVLVTGGFQVYAPTGRLSFVARSLQVSGEGLLRQQVAALARRLEAEGLMDPARKRKVPAFCTRVAVVTSPSGSVIDDVKRTLARRNPLVEILVSGCAVQGEGAPAQIIAALRRAAAARPEAILLVRGGGSFEDLMTFNDEALARAVAAWPIPVVTGIGHEPDTSICDMVADRRCSTPTAAAESVAPAFDEIARQFHERERRLAHAMAVRLEAQEQFLGVLGARALQAQQNRLSAMGAQVDSLASRRCMSDPLSTIEGRVAQLELTAERLHTAAPRVLDRLSAQVDGLAERSCLRDPMAPLRIREAQLDQMAMRLNAAPPRELKLRRQTLERSAERLLVSGPRVVGEARSIVSHGAAQLDALSPLRVLARGYAIMRDSEGHVVSEASSVKVGDKVSVLLGSGRVAAEIQDVDESDRLADNAPFGRR